MVIRNSVILLDQIETEILILQHADQCDDEPFPETRPATIDGWSVRDVYGEAAVL